MKVFIKTGLLVLMIVCMFAVFNDKYETGFIQQANATNFPTYEDGLKDAKFGKEKNPTPSIIIVKVIIFILSFVAALIVVFLIVGGIMYITSGADDKRTEMAKDIIVHAIYGLIVMLFSWVIVNIISKVIAT